MNILMYYLGRLRNSCSIQMWMANPWGPRSEFFYIHASLLHFLYVVSFTPQLNIIHKSSWRTQRLHHLWDSCVHTHPDTYVCGDKCAQKHTCTKPLPCVSALRVHVHFISWLIFTVACDLSCREWFWGWLLLYYLNTHIFTIQLLKVSSSFLCHGRVSYWVKYVV